MTIGTGVQPIETDDSIRKYPWKYQHFDWNKEASSWQIEMYTFNYLKLNVILDIDFVKPFFPVLLPPPHFPE